MLRNRLHFEGVYYMKNTKDLLAEVPGISGTMPGIGNLGLIAGALTSTPGLAVAIDSTHSPLASIAYGIAYPFGVIGVILFVKLLPKLFGVDLKEEAHRLERERRSQFPELATKLFKVTNPSVAGRTLAQLNIRAVTGAVVSRLKKNGEVLMPSAHTVLEEGDSVQAVGSEEALNNLESLLGVREELYDEGGITHAIWTF